MKNKNPTSIKELFQEMNPKGLAIIQGIVTSTNPLKIQAVNDEKHVMPEAILIVPRHLTDYSVKGDITLGDGFIDGGTGVGEYVENGDSDGSSNTNASHIHSLSSFNITNAVITFHNALKEGELVDLLSFNNSKKYYILDRAV